MKSHCVDFRRKIVSKKKSFSFDGILATKKKPRLMGIPFRKIEYVLVGFRFAKIQMNH